MIYRFALFALVYLFALAVQQAAIEVDPNDVYFRNARLRFNERTHADRRIVIAGIDEAVFEQNLFNRRTHAKVIRNVTEAGCQAIFYDLLFDENRDEEDDRLLREAIEQWGRVVVAAATTTDENGVVHYPKMAPHLQPVVDEHYAELGLIDNSIGEDGVLRNYILAAVVEGQSVPSAALASYSLLNALRSRDIRYWEDEIEVPPSTIPVRRTKDRDVTLYVFPMTFHPPATGPGHQPGPNTYTVVPYLDLLDPTPELKQRLAGSVIMVGENTKTPDDLVKTPAGVMKGVEAHAQALDSLLQGNYYAPVSERVRVSVYFGLALAVASLGLLRLPLATLNLIGVLMISGYAALNFYLFQQQHLELPMGPPFWGSLGALFALNLMRLTIITRFLGRFIPQEAVRSLLSAGKIADATQATVIVTDIRGYTTLSETRTPVQMLQLLNQYHSVTVDIYHKHGGNVLTFQGDAQLVVFGYPRKLKDAVGAAVRASVEVQEAIDKLRQEWGIAERSNFDVGAGICTGLVYIGDIGSRDQANYTVIGETVRTSHKVQSMSTALAGNVLMDEPSYRACKVKPEVTAIPGVELEGFPHPKTLYRVEATAQK